MRYSGVMVEIYVRYRLNCVALLTFRYVLVYIKQSECQTARLLLNKEK